MDLRGDARSTCRAWTARQGISTSQSSRRRRSKSDSPPARRAVSFPLRRSTRSGRAQGRIGDKVFDDFVRTQVQFLAGTRQEELTRDANVALLDAIGTPVILVTHSQSGPFGWAIANARPNQVKAIVAVEPGGPPLKDTDNVKVTYLEPPAGNGGRVWGITNTALAYEPAAAAPSDLQIEFDEQVRAGSRRLLPAEGARAEAEEPPEHSRARADGGSQLSRCLRSLHGAVADAGRREDRACGARKGRHVGQRAHDDAREEQRRHRQVHRRLALEERARGVGRERVEGDARQGDPDVLDREHRAQRICLRRWQLLGCARISR